MTLGLILATAVAAGQPAASPAPTRLPVAATASSQAVTDYPASFFASALPATAMDMVARLPGFSFDGGDGSRGLYGAGNVLIDGRRPAAKDDNLSQILSRIPASSVLKIELIRGGAPGIDMQGKTVLANVIRKSEDSSKLTAVVSSGFVFDGRVKPDVTLEATTRRGGTQFDASIESGSGFDNGAEDGPYREVAGDGTLLLAGPEANRTDVLFDKATAALETDAYGGRLRANISLMTNPYTAWRDDELTTPPGQDEYEHDKQSNQTAEIGLHYDHPLGPKASLETYALQRFGGTGLVSLYSAPSDIESYGLDTRTGESVLRGDIKLNPSKTLSFEAGGEGDFNFLTNSTLYVVNAAPVILPGSNDRVQEKRGELFGTATWNVRPDLTLETGLRLEGSTISATGDVVNSNTFVFAKPRVAITWSVNSNDQVRLRVEREVSQLDFGQFTGSAQFQTGTIQVGNPNLSPSQDWVYEAVLDHRFWGSGEATLTLRHFEYADVIDRFPIYAPSGAYDAPGNIGKGRWDAALFSLTLPMDKLGIPQGLFTYSSALRRSEVTDPTTGLERPFSGMHRLDQEAHFSQGLPKWKALWGIDINGGWKEIYYRFDEIDEVRLGSFADIYAEYKPTPATTLRAQFNNPTSRGLKLVSAIYSGPRNIDPIAYTDYRLLPFGQWVDVSLRRTF